MSYGHPSSSYSGRYSGGYSGRSPVFIQKTKNPKTYKKSTVTGLPETLQCGVSSSVLNNSYDHIGKGNYGSVYKVCSKDASKCYAYKHQFKGCNESNLNQEWSMYKKIHDASKMVPNMYDSLYCSPSQCYQVTDYIKGPTLDVLLKNKSKSDKEWNGIMISLKRALEKYVASHAYGHGDFNTKNIILSPNGNWVFIDIGATRQGRLWWYDWLVLMYFLLRGHLLGRYGDRALWVVQWIYKNIPDVSAYLKKHNQDVNAHHVLYMFLQKNARSYIVT